MKETAVILLAHQGPEWVGRLMEMWGRCVPRERIVLAHGGAREDFDASEAPAKFWVGANSGLRVDDPQRDFQSYAEVFRQAVTWLGDARHVFFVEYDHLPLRADAVALFRERLARERADVLGHRLVRVDGTSNPHWLYHSTLPGFAEYWQGLSCRADRGVVLSMLGTGSFWTREVFEAVALAEQPFPIYLELFLPTLVHHLGFRLRDLPDQNPWVRPAGELGGQLDRARAAGAWTAHPVKSKTES